MSTVDLSELALQMAYMQGPKSFIVMNNFTSQQLIKELVGLRNVTFVTITTYEDLEVLISESLKDYEFRIG